jgi:hypothetical protein
LTGERPSARRLIVNIELVKPRQDRFILLVDDRHVASLELLEDRTVRVERYGDLPIGKDDFRAIVASFEKGWQSLQADAPTGFTWQVKRGGSGWSFGAANGRAE